MGLNIENGPRSLPVESRAEQASYMIGDRVENSFRHGGTLYSNGDFGGYGSVFLKINGNNSEELESGRIIVCGAQEVEPGLYSRSNYPEQHIGIPRKALVIPEGSDRRLAYQLRKHNNKHVVLLHGIDDLGNPVTDDLFYAYGFLRFFDKMGQRMFHKQDVTPNAASFSYRRAVVKRLEEMALPENGGLGEFDQAVGKMRDESRAAIDEVIKIVNGK